jgi:hypothetical protein
MKKEQVKKLELHRETLRRLEDEKLEDAAGGRPTAGRCIEAVRTNPRTTC